MDAGGGIFFFWQAGVVLALREKLGERLSRCALSGVSAGALSAVLAACDVDVVKAVEAAYALSKSGGVYDRPAGLAGVWGALIKSWLESLLTEDAAARCSGRVSLVTLVVWPLPSRHLTVTHYRSSDDVIDAALASIHIPLFLDGKATYKSRGGQRCIDGSVFARRGIVDVAPGRSLLIDHNDDPRIGHNRKLGDFVALTSKAGLDNMVAMGQEWMRAELASGRLDAWLALVEAADDEGART